MCAWKKSKQMFSNDSHPQEWRRIFGDGSAGCIPTCEPRMLMDDRWRWDLTPNQLHSVHLLWIWEENSRSEEISSSLLLFCKRFKIFRFSTRQTTTSPTFTDYSVIFYFNSETTEADIWHSSDTRLTKRGAEKLEGVKQTDETKELSWLDI